MRMSQLALDRLTKPWEEFVAYPYDDKIPKRLHPGEARRRYPEWTGGPARGTITIGYGHTDAAGTPKIESGMRVSIEEATRILADDIRPCEAAVARLITAPLGQHQADTLIDFVFNAGAGTLQKSTLRRKLNAGDYDCVPAELMRFTLSKGEHMDGLTHRRQAEIGMWNTPDDKPHAAKVAPEDHGVDDDDVLCPKGEAPVGRSPLDSKEIAAGVTAIATGAATHGGGQAAPPTADTVGTALDQVRSAKDQLEGLGLWDSVAGFIAHHTSEIGAVVVAGLILFMVAKRFLRLRIDHV